MVRVELLRFSGADASPVAIWCVIWKEVDGHERTRFCDSPASARIFAMQTACRIEIDVYNFELERCHQARLIGMTDLAATAFQTSNVNRNTMRYEEV